MQDLACSRHFMMVSFIRVLWVVLPLTLHPAACYHVESQISQLAVSQGFSGRILLLLGLGFFILNVGVRRLPPSQVAARNYKPIK